MPPMWTGLLAPLHAAPAAAAAPAGPNAPSLPSHPRKKMNFSKLLCLVLVFSQQFGQVLLTETPVQTIEDCTGTGGSTVTCKRKKGENVKLTIGGAVSASVEWKKGTTTIEAVNNKYVLDADNNKILTIQNLAEGDEGEYTAGVTPAQKFQVQVVPVCHGKQSEKVTCKGKPGGELELNSADASGPYAWTKGDTTITEDAAKYSGLNVKAMTIMKLDDDDEGEYKGTNNDKEIVVQVADCFGGDAGSTVTCNGKQGENLKLRISGSVTTGTVTWEKVDGQLERHEKKGNKHEGLILKTLAAPNAGTYKATYDTSTTESFTVSIPGTNEGGSGGGGSGGSGGGTTKKPTTTGGGGRGSTTDTVVVHDNSGGSGSVLSYSPALLVTVTLVHLLLQLAA